MRYVGITIGPIYDTLSLSSSPAALWASSYLFSYISGRLCGLIVRDNLVADERDILSPYFCASDETLNKRDGIGLYHDRILFKPAISFEGDKEFRDKVKGLFTEVIKDVGRAFGDKPETEEALTDWLARYLQLHAVCFESDGQKTLEDASKYLDAIELEKTFPGADGKVKNPLVTLFEHKQKNTKIREQFMKAFALRSVPFPLRKETDEDGNTFLRMPRMDEITGLADEAEGSRRKTNAYYAIVQTDGDMFGKYISGKEPREVSKQCLTFCASAAQVIRQYGGVPIYAGGDDLLFIAPLISAKQNDIYLLDLLTMLRTLFVKTFGSGVDSPTISFGAAICYYKYPLYEAFSEAYKMLFLQAKTKRNAAGISLLKHSGQAVRFVIEDFRHNPVTGMIQAMIASHMQEDVLKSIAGHIALHKPLFIQALGLIKENNASNALENIFDNTFDSVAHGEKKGNIDKVRDLLLALVEKERPVVRAVDDPAEVRESRRDTLAVLDELLRFCKFWGEKGDEDDGEAID